MWNVLAGLLTRKKQFVLAAFEGPRAVQLQILAWNGYIIFDNGKGASFWIRAKRT